MRIAFASIEDLIARERLAMAPVDRRVSGEARQQTFFDQRRLKVWGAVALAIACFFAGRFLVSDIHLWTNLSWDVAALLAMLKSFSAARHATDARSNLAWRNFGAGCLAWFIGMLLWTYHEEVRSVSTPFPSVADAGYLARAIFFAIGLSYYRTDHPDSDLGRVVLANLGIALLAMLIAVLISFRVSTFNFEHDFVYTATALAYPVLCLAVAIFGLFHLGLHAKPEHQVEVRLITLGLTVHGIASTLYAHQLLGRSYEVGAYMDGAWIVACAAQYLAAHESMQVHHDGAATAYDSSPASSLRVFLRAQLPAIVLVALALNVYAFRADVNERLIALCLPPFILLAVLFGVRDRLVHAIETRALRAASDAGAALRKTEEYYRIAFEAAHDHMWVWDIRTDVLTWVDSSKDFLGYRPEQLPTDALFRTLIHPDDRPRYDASVSQAMQGTDDTWEIEIRFRRADGTYAWIRDSARFMRDERGQVISMIGSRTDITVRKNAEEALRASAARYTALIEAAPDAIYVNRGGKIVLANQACVRLFGARSTDEVLGRSPFDFIHPSFHAVARERIEQMTQAGKSLPFVDQKVQRLDGSSVDVEVASAPFVDGKTTAVHVVLRDISERKASEERIRRLAELDFLTGLPNRVLLQDRLQQTLAAAKRQDGTFALMFIDLDRFKNINDSLGHRVGDLLLQELGLRLKGLLREHDTVSRQGGDEFVVLLPDVKNADDAKSIAVKIVNAVSMPYRINEHELTLTASIGISMYPNDGLEIETLMKNADSAMYHAKNSGRNNFQFFSKEMNLRTVEALTIENALRRALERNELELHYQPIVDTASGAIVGMEALARWTSRDLGPVSPARFIPIAEDTGLILPIGEWILREACRQNRQWHQEGTLRVPVSVNLSAVQFRQNSIVAVVQAALAAAGLDAAHLELEITESAFVYDIESARATTRAFKDMGVSLAVDDFGTGYSSLAYLRHFPVDKLKVDQSFIRDISSDPYDAAICSAIISMAKELRLAVVAEGVETDLQLHYLHQHGCEIIQGYLLSKPMRAEQVPEFVRSMAASGSLDRIARSG
jgi:diguanylate cyclase (GGDEF)-like protein/PAS domain S-box-containing protein